MMLLLAAVRVERAADAARADLVAAVDAILLHRPKLRDNGATAGAAAEGPRRSH